jgi:apolipoprotein D and lipocalin family protein
VINQCRRANGRLDIARGRARVVDPASRAKLKVTFAPALLQWLPGAWADYWILDVSPDYRRALVGTPDRKSLWVLAREASLPDDEYHAMLLQATALGFETQRMRRTTHRSVL